MREVQKNIRKNAPEKKIYILPHKAKDYQEKQLLLEEMTKSKKLQENIVQEETKEEKLISITADL